jgi:exodeoxyribonuclease-3
MTAKSDAAAALRPSMSPPGRAPGLLRVATWNVNSLRPRMAAVGRFLERVGPDVLCLQETKATELSAEVLEMLACRAYRAVNVGNGGYNGVAVVSRYEIEPEVVSGQFGDEHLDREPRVLSCLLEGPFPLRVVTVYVPHGRTVDHWHYRYKLSFLDSLAERVRKWLAEDVPLILTGDFNVAPTDSDVFHPRAFEGSTHVTGAERDALGRILDAGLVDVDVAKWGPRARRFTWWNHGIGYSRNLGMRIDLLAASADLASALEATWIDHTERGSERPSDHAALIADFACSDAVTNAMQPRR